MKGKLTDLLLYAAGIQNSVRLQCTDGVEALFDESIHDVTACIPAIAKKIRDYWRYGQFLCNFLHDLYFRHGLVVHDKGIVKDDSVAGEHDNHSLTPVVLFSLEVGLVEIGIFNRMQSP